MNDDGPLTIGEYWNNEVTLELLRRMPASVQLLCESFFYAGAHAMLSAATAGVRRDAISTLRSLEREVVERSRALLAECRAHAAEADQEVTH
jgi:hypothetical protein